MGVSALGVYACSRFSESIPLGALPVRRVLDGDIVNASDTASFLLSVPHRLSRAFALSTPWPTANT